MSKLETDLLEAEQRYSRILTAVYTRRMWVALLVVVIVASGALLLGTNAPVFAVTLIVSAPMFGFALHSDYRKDIVTGRDIEANCLNFELPSGGHLLNARLAVDSAKLDLERARLDENQKGEQLYSRGDPS